MSGQIFAHQDLTGDTTLDCDVCIIGSGAGGGVTAARLTAMGLSVVVLEDGGNNNRSNFSGEESDAYPRMYQERGLRATDDLAISILQGRTLGGGTTINWTTCFRTPPRILAHWAQRHGVLGWSEAELAPHFAAVEERLGIETWPADRANPNNKVLLDGCESLGWEVSPLRRNVRGCANTGMCGVGCPIDAKQGMHVTYLADAVAGGCRVYTGCRVQQLVEQNNRIREVQAILHDPVTDRPTGATIRVRAKVTVSSAGAINGPALLLRSGLNPNGRVGHRTMLHPVVAMPAIYPHPINGFYGAPQSISSHQFVERGPNQVGFFLETPPLQPMLMATGSPAFGVDQQRLMQQLPNLGALLALAVDGLQDDVAGGVLTLRNDGRPRLNYPVTPALVEAFREAHKTMARIQLAAGAVEIQSSHLTPIQIRNEADIAQFDAAPFGALEHSIFTAHQMGGCTMGSDPSTTVVDNRLRHHIYHNLFVVDGSVLPTALGVNPSQTIYGIAHRAAEYVAEAV